MIEKLAPDHVGALGARRFMKTVFGLERLAARFNALQAKVLAEIDRSVESFHITETNAAALRSLADAQAKRRDAVAAQLKAGAADQVDLLNAEFESATYELVALDNQIKLRQALGALEDAIQRPLALPEAIFRSQRSDAR